MRTLLLGVALVVAGCVTAPPEEASVRLSDHEKVDLFEAVVRSRLAAAPLARHSVLYLYLNEGALPQLAGRFPEYRTIVRSGSPGNSPIAARWYYLHLGRTYVDHAFVWVEGSGDAPIIELRRSDKRWIVVGSRPFILT